VFVDSMSDLFYEGFSNEQIAAVFGVMAACPKHTFIILTKRAKRMREWFEWAARHGDGQDLMRFAPSALLTCAWEACAGDVWGDIEPPGKLESIPSPDVFGTTWPLPNVWLGVSVENQDAADERIPDLLATPSEVRLLSCEPLIGQVDLSDRVGTWTDCTECGRGVKVDEDGCCTGCGLDAIHYGVDWVIAGCESGPGARPCDIAWVRSLRDQCAAASVPYFLKQAVGHNDGQFWELEVGGADIASIDAGPGSKSKPRGVIDLPYLDGVQHAAFPISPASSAEPRAVIEGK
jgi:protein gp37